MALNVGSRIAHYNVTALIGEGGMGDSGGRTTRSSNTPAVLYAENAVRYSA